MFWAEVPEAGKKSVLMSNEAPCVPPRNVRQFVELLLERDDKETADAILRNYFSCLDAKDPEPRKKIATGLAQLADLYPGPGGDLMAAVIRKIGEQICKENDSELQSMAAILRDPARQLLTDDLQIGAARNTIEQGQSVREDPRRERA